MTLEIVRHSPAVPLILEPVHGTPREANPYFVYTNALDSRQSARVQRQCLDRIARLLLPGLAADLEEPGAVMPWWWLRMEHTAKLRSVLLEQTTPPRRPGEDPEPWSPSYVNQHLTALRRVLEVCWDLELIGTDEYLRARKIKNVKGSRERAGRHLAEVEIHALLRVCLEADGLGAKRDAAAVAVLHSTGLRVAELVDARRRDYSPGDRLLQVIGKGNKQRTVAVHEDAATYLGRWLVATEHVTGPLFCPVMKSGTAVNRRMSPKAVEDLLEKRRRVAGLPALTTHDFRRTLASNLLDMGVDVVTVKEILGHESIETTAMYDRRSERKRREVIDRLHLPSAAELLAA